MEPMDETSPKPVSKPKKCRTAHTVAAPAHHDDDDGETKMDEEDEPKTWPAEGRKEPCGNLKLLKTGDQLYVPITQDPSPMTEDVIQEQIRILSQLGTGAESSQLRAKLQTASLLSDMEAFKAANPGCTFEDYVRWHSPRDWIKDASDATSMSSEGDLGSSSQSSSAGADVMGHLSPRMQTPGNLWLETWARAKPVPVSRQKRLFDFVKEGEKVLHFFTSLTLNDLVNHLNPVIIHQGLIQLLLRRRRLELTDDQLPCDTQRILRLAETQDWPTAIGLIHRAELQLHRFESLWRKLTAAHELEYGVSVDRPTALLKSTIIKLMSEPEIVIQEAGRGPIGRTVRRLIYEHALGRYQSIENEAEQEFLSNRLANNQLPEPTAKEFIFRSTVPRPNPHSKPTPQRLYCVITGNEFRLAGAFSEDITFF